jgi:hypothetical protein
MTTQSATKFMTANDASSDKLPGIQFDVDIEFTGTLSFEGMGWTPEVSIDGWKITRIRAYLGEALLPTWVSDDMSEKHAAAIVDAAVGTFRGGWDFVRDKLRGN